MNKEIRYNREEGQKIYRQLGHDLKGGLRNISCIMDIINTDFKEELSQELKVYLSHIAKSYRRMLTSVTIAEDLYALTNSKFHFSNISLDELFEQFINGPISTLVENKNALLVKKKKLGYLYTNPLLIQKLFTILVENALLYNTAERPQVFILRDYSSQNIKITFEDNGVGFPSEFEEKPGFFCKTNPKLNPKSKAIGLGILQKILDLHDGHFTIEKNRPTGSKVFLVFDLQNKNSLSQRH